MAACSAGQIGALNSESFCERVLSAGNLVVNEGNTLLNPEEVEMLAVLRINRTFMEYMRTHYSKEAKQQFMMTAVPDESTEASGSNDAPAPNATPPPTANVAPIAVTCTPLAASRTPITATAVTEV